ncbi:MAG: enoyl-CoA hydratase-related protein, partial [Paracoccaceae bacterium]
MTDRTTGYATRDGVAVLTLPAVPSLLDPVARDGLEAMVLRAHADPEARALVLTGPGRIFALGDGDHPGEGPKDWAALGALCSLIETGPKPAVAALGGAALGAGLALACAMHARLALPQVRLGVSALSVGLVPGAGLTQRLSRLLPMGDVLALIRAAQPLAARDLTGAGFVECVAVDALDAACAHARALSEQGWRPARDAPPGRGDPAATQKVLSEARAGAPEDPALDETLSCLEASLMLPFEAGLDFEAAALEALHDTTRSRVLRHLWAAGRRLSAPALPAQAMAAPLVPAVLGHGRTAASLAVMALQAGLEAVVADPAAAEVATEVDAILQRQVRRGRLSAQGADAMLTGLHCAARPEALGRATIVIECGPGDAAARAGRWEAARPALAETALCLPLWPGRGAGPVLAFHGPPHVARLAELLVPEGTETKAHHAMALLRRAGKMVLVSRGARPPTQVVEEAVWRAALWLALAGADPFALDRARRAAGFATGPFEAMQQAGPAGLAARLVDAPAPLQAALARLAEGGVAFYGRDGAPDAALVALLDGL